jgi:hypothetical protein
MASRLPVDLFSVDLPEKSLREAFCGDLELLLKQSLPHIENSIQAVELQGLPVFEVGCQFHLRALMMLSNLDYGFVSPQTEHYSDIVETLKKYFPDKASVNTAQGLILLTSRKESTLQLIMALYHWKAFTSGLPGYSESASRLYRVVQKRYRGRLPHEFMAVLSTEDLMALRARMKREEESLAFLRETLDRVVIPKNNAGRLSQGQAEA